nr:MAG TPA: hypothetical protein [Caudoviricetes sp.]
MYNTYLWHLTILMILYSKNFNPVKEFGIRTIVYLYSYTRVCVFGLLCAL